MKQKIHVLGALAIVIVLVTAWMQVAEVREPEIANANDCTGETCYGGRNYFTLVCTCDDNGSDLLFLMDYKTNQLLKLYYVPGQSKLYLYYLVFAPWLLGSYDQSSDVCKVGYEPYCAEITADGTLGDQPGSGTSLL